MRIGFLIERDTRYKVLGSIIEEALKRGHQVFCLHDFSQPQNGPKGYQFPSFDKMPKFRAGIPQVISFSDTEDLIKIIKEHGIQVLVGLQFLPRYIDLHKELKKIGVFLVSVQSSADVVTQGAQLHLPDRYFIYSDVWLELSVACLAERGIIKQDEIVSKIEKLKSTVKSIGFPEIDQLSLIEPASVRAGWGIPKDKPVVLFLPFPFHCTHDRFWAPFIYGLDNYFLQLPIASLCFKMRYIKQVLKKHNDKTVVKAIRKFCDNNNAYLLVKSREKEPARGYLIKAADKVVYDEGYYPDTILRCLSISNLCLNFLSFAVLETVPMGVPNVCIAPCVQDYKNFQNLFWKTIYKRQRQIYDFPGASYILSIPDVIELLPKKSIADFPLNPEKQSQYIQKFVGPYGGNYSSNIITEIENLLKIQH